MSYEVKMMTIDGIQKMVCPICGKPTIIARNGDIETLSAQAHCSTCSSSFSFEHKPNGEIDIWNIRVSDFSKYSDAVNGKIADDKQYEALKKLFDLMQIRAIKRRTRDINENTRDINDNVVDILCCNVNTGKYFTIDTLSEKVYNRHFKILFEKEEKADV